MRGKTEVAKGRIKEAAGALADNNELRKEGKADQEIGNAKVAAEKMIEKIEKSTRTVIDKI